MSRHFKTLQSGFTLLEMLVSIGIFLVIMSVVVSNQSHYTEVASLNNAANTISLTLAEARAYGVGVRELTPGSGDFNISYGLHFLLDSAGGSNINYISWADRDGDLEYSDDWTCSQVLGSECLEKLLINGGNTIVELCDIRDPGSTWCNVGRVDVVFVRPRTEASILLFDNAGGLVDHQHSVGAQIVLESPVTGDTKTVSVYKSGQISVQ